MCHISLPLSHLDLSPSREDKKRHSHRPSQLECFCVPASHLQPVRSFHSQRAGVQGRLFKKSALDLLIEPLLADTPYPVHQAEIDPIGRRRSIKRVITFPVSYGLGRRHSGFELSCLPRKKKGTSHGLRRVHSVRLGHNSRE